MPPPSLAHRAGCLSFFFAAAKCITVKVTHSVTWVSLLFDTAPPARASGIFSCQQHSQILCIFICGYICVQHIHSWKTPAACTWMDMGERKHTLLRCSCSKTEVGESQLTSSKTRSLPLVQSCNYCLFLEFIRLSCIFLDPIWLLIFWIHKKWDELPQKLLKKNKMRQKYPKAETTFRISAIENEPSVQKSLFWSPLTAQSLRLSSGAPSCATHPIRCVAIGAFSTVAAWHCSESERHYSCNHADSLLPELELGCYATRPRVIVASS